MAVAFASEILFIKLTLNFEMRLGFFVTVMVVPFFQYV